HPNFVRQIVAEDIARLRDARFFEVYNGHPYVRNQGTEDEPSVERLWDIVLTLRLREAGGSTMLALATDDAHDFAQWGVGKANPGRGWVMVRAARLSADAIMNAMLAGDFYATTGVVLQDITFSNNTLTVQICPEPGVTYTTQFIGTRKGYDATAKPRKDDAPDAYFTKVYSDEVGQVLAEQTGTTAAYTLTGDELYVRAKVISSAKHTNPHAEGDLQEAWVQPVTPIR
ncbi:MAG: hypothetical protein JXA69_17200, partial [Phycisphaerae bacterium]|nr:hypothetical protein [Phycisphaerae bacterium]